MFQEKRPTCVTVIGWTWIILGGLMCLSATMAFFGSILAAGMKDHVQNAPIIFKVFPFLCLIQIGAAVFGLASGIHFLKMKSWARGALEGLTWLLLLFIAGFAVIWAYRWSDSPASAIFGAAMAVAITSFYGVPLGIMLKYLRGPKVRNALGFAPSSTGGSPATGPGAPPSTPPPPPRAPTS